MGAPPKLCYFIQEYEWLGLFIPPIFEKLAKQTRLTVGAPLHGRSLHRRPHHGRSEDFFYILHASKKLRSKWVLVGTLGS